jgi:hypothetical protein
MWPDDLTVRRLLTWRVVRSGGEVSVAELVAWLEDAGFRPPVRTSKIVADRLRSDVRRGRLRRVGRGRYAAGRIAPTTWHRIRTTAESALREAQGLGTQQTERAPARDAA